MTSPEDAAVLSFLHGLLGGTLCITSLSLALAAARSRSLAHAISSATPLPLTRGAPPETTLADGSWVSVSGEVACSGEPLLSYNKDAGVVLEEVERRSQLRLDDRSLVRRSFVVSRSVRDVAWLLAPVGGAGAADAGALPIARDCVRLAAERDARRLRDLSPGGVLRLSPGAGTLATLLKALAGVVEEEAESVHALLPLGVPATLLAAVSVVDGRVVGLGLHPLLSLLLCRERPGALAGELARGAALRGAGAALAGALAAWQLWRAARAAMPALRPARRALVEAAAALLGEAAAAKLLPAAWLRLGGEGERGTGGARGGGAPTGGRRPSRSAPPLAAPPASDIPASEGGAGAACVVCCERQRVAVLTGCGHLVLCLACAMRLAAQEAPRCPMCRAPFLRRDVVRVFGAGVT